MDPINNPTPNPNPNPETPTPEPAGPAPAAPVPPAPSSDLPEVPEGLEAAAAAELTNTPGVNAANPASTSPAFQPGEPSAIDPIMAPEPPKAPDPVEEELKSPMKAADPVPGSIGSSVSGPAGTPDAVPANNPFANNQTPNVSFNDPQAAQGAPMAAANGKKLNKKNLIILIAVAAVVVIGLVVVLIMSMGGSNSTSSNNNSTSSVVEEEEEEEDEVILGENTLSCTRNMTSEEILKYNDAVSGVISISAEFNDEDTLANISLVESVVYSDEDATDNEPVDMAVHESTAEKLNSRSALTYYLKATDSGVIDLDLESIQTNYEDLDFTCEVL